MKYLPLLTLLLVSGFTATTAVAQSPIRPGDRIAIVGNTFADQLRMHGYLETLLLQHTRGKRVSIRNLGWGGDMLTARDRPTNFPSEASTLTEHKTDVIIACFGMGESFGGESQVEKFQADLRGFIASHQGKSYNGESEVRLILVSPIACEDLGSLTPERGQRNRELAVYTQAMSEVATAHQIPFVNLFEPSRYLMEGHSEPKLTNNGIHLNRLGYWAMCHSFYDQLAGGNGSPAERRWRLRIDAEKNTSEAQGVAISKVEIDGNGLSFRVAETSPPSLPPPTRARLALALEEQRDQLVVENLKPGKYRLTVDGKPVATADEKAWADGVAIDASPAHRAIEEYRAAVNDKNLQFTYSWKALNQVHIVGERRGSPSGKALPGEVIEFNRLANQRDDALSQGIPLKTRQWHLSRIAP